jgi:hypothetical protein
VAGDGRHRGKTGGRELTPTEVWANAVAAGIPDELYWQLTPPEARALMKAIHEREVVQARAANLRFGLIAAELRNARRTRKTDRIWKAEDFFETGEKKDDRPKVLESPEEITAAFRAFARAHNQRIHRA